MRYLWLLLLLFPLMALAQDELLLDDEEEMDTQEEVKCIPDTLTVPFEAYKGTAETPTDVKRWYSFGSEHQKNKNYDAALPYLWKVFFNDSGKYANRAIGKIAEAYFKKQKADSSLLACYIGLKVFPDQQKLHYYAGYLENKLGRYKCAIPHYENLVKQNPKNKNYMEELALLYFRVGDEKAIEVQQKVTELYPDDVKAADKLGSYTQALLGSAIEVWREAFKKDHNNIKAARSYGKEAVVEGSFEEAIEPLTAVINKDPKADDYKYRALAYSNLKQYSKAIADLKAWLKLEPDNLDIMLEIAYNYSSAGSLKTANNWINKVLAKKPGYGAAYIAKGELYETAVLFCQKKRGSNKTELEDKLVYERAQAQYKKAMKDLSVKVKARNKYNNLKPYIRTKEDKFMNPGIKITSDCYSFIK
ncbi:MAG TPA: hypothetical protein ENJ15_00235 [Caldithrix abyssi]|uniref:Tetratricopeptide repeat protein n=1 Tax=Caldithrix abyssi TaxID=187145 RepID=A0A7V5RNT8_CALAY|nr:hypothetical protein [Caldithrix abyssi]